MKLPRVYVAPIFTAFILCVTIALGSCEHSSEQGTIDNPKVDDVYRLYYRKDVLENRFHFYRVVAVEGDSVSIGTNQMYYPGVPAAIDSPDFFYKFSFKLHKDSLKRLYETEEIAEITHYDKLVRQNR